MSTPPRDMRQWMQTVERKLAQATRSGNASVIAVAQREYDKIREEISETAADPRTPAAPVEFTFQTELRTDSNGKDFGTVNVDFATVTKATDGTTLAVERYELWARDITNWDGTPATAPAYALKASNLQSQITMTGLAPESKWQVKVRAFGVTAVFPGEWSAEYTIQIGVDTTPPPVLPAPVLTQKLGVVTLDWNGLAANGAAMPGDFRHSEIAVGPETSPTTVVNTRMQGAGTVPFVGLPYGQPTYFRIRGVDWTGNKSQWSATASITVQPLVSGDISGLDTTLQQQVDRAENAEQAAVDALTQAQAAEQAARDAQAAAETADASADASEAQALQAAADAAAAQSTAATAQADAARAAADAETARLAAVQAETDAEAAFANLQSFMNSSGRVIQSETEPGVEDQSENNLWVKPSTGEVFVWVPAESRWDEIENQDYAQTAANAAASAAAAESSRLAAVAAEAAAKTAQTNAQTAAQEAATLEQQAAASKTAAEAAQAAASTAQQAATAAEARATTAESSASAAQAAAEQSFTDLQTAIGESAQIVRQENAPTGDLARDGVLWIKDSTGESFTWHNVDLEWKLVDNVRIAEMAAAADAAADQAEASRIAADAAKAEATTAKSTAQTAQANASTAQAAAEAAEGRADQAEADALAAQQAAAAAQSAAVAAEGRADQSAADAALALQNLNSYMDTAGRIIRQDDPPTGDAKSINNLWIKDSTGQSFTYDATADQWVEVDNEKYAAAAAAADAAADRAEAAEAAALAAEAEATTAQQAATAAQGVADGLVAQANAAQAAAEAAQAAATTAQNNAAASEAAALAAEQKAINADTKADAAEAKALQAMGVASGKGQVWTQPTAPAAGTTYSWTGTPHNSASVMKVDGVEVRRNLAINPSFENNTSSWGVSASTAALSTGFAHTGKRSVALTPTGANGQGDLRSAGASQTQMPWGIQAGKTYTFSAFLKRDTVLPSLTNRSMRILVWTSTNGLNWVERFGPHAANTTAKQRVSHTFTVDTNMTGILLGLGCAVPTGVPLTPTMYDGILIEEGSTVGEYFDGDTPDERAYDLWIDTANGNTPKRWDGATDSWVSVTDQNVLNAAAAAALARDDAEAAQAAAVAAQGEATTAKNTAATAQQNAQTAQAAAEAAEGRADTASAEAAAAQAAASAAEARADAAEAAAAQSADDAHQSMLDLQVYMGTSGRVIYQEAEPAAEDRSVNNLWIKPSDGTSWVWDAANLEWEQVENAVVAQAAADADAAADRALAAEQAAQQAEADALTAQQNAGTAAQQATAAQEAATAAQTAAQSAEQRAQTAEANAAAAAADAQQAFTDLQTEVGKSGKIIYQDAEPTGDDRDPNNLWIKDSTGEVFAYDELLTDWVLVESVTIRQMALDADAAADRAEAAEGAATTARNEATTAKNSATAAQTAATTAQQNAAAAQTAAEAAEGRAQTAEQSALDAQAAAEQSFNDLQGFLNDAGKVIHQEAEPTGDDRNPNNLWIKDSTGEPYVFDPAANGGAGAWTVVTDQRVVQMAADADAAADAAAAAETAANAAKGEATTAKQEADAAAAAAANSKTAADNAAAEANASKAAADQAAADAATAAQEAAQAAADAEAAAQAAGSSSAAALAAEEAAEAAQGRADAAVAEAAAIAAVKGAVYMQGTAPADDPNGLWIDTSKGNIPKVLTKKNALYKAEGGGANANIRFGNEGWTVTTTTEALTLEMVEPYDLLIVDSGYGLIGSASKAVIKAAYEAGKSVFTTGNDTSSIPPLFTGTAQRGTELSNPIRRVPGHPVSDAGGWESYTDGDLRLYLTGVHASAAVLAVAAVGGVDQPMALALEDPDSGARWVHIEPYAAPTPVAFTAAAADWLAARWIEVQDQAIVDAAAIAAQAVADASAAHELAGQADDTANAALNAATHAGKNLFSPDPPSGTAPKGTIWFQHKGDGTVIGQWEQTGGTAPTAEGGGVVGSTWVKRDLASEVIANLDVGKLTGGYIDASHIDADTLTVGGSTLAEKVEGYDATRDTVLGITDPTTGKVLAGEVSGTFTTGQIPTLDQSKVSGLDTIAQNASTAKSKVEAVTDPTTGKVVATQVSGTLATGNIPNIDASKVTSGTLPTAVKVGDGSINSGISPAKLTGTGTIPETKVPALTEAKIPVLTEAKIPTLAQSKITNLTSDLSTLNSAAAKAQAAANEAIASAETRLVNGGFERDLEGWNREGTGTTGHGIDLTVARTGTKSFYTTGQGSYTQPGFPVVVGDTWRYEWWYKTVADWVAGVAGGLRLQKSTDGGVTFSDAASTSLNLNTEWTLSSVEYKVPAGVTHLRARIAFSYQGGKQAWMDDMRLTNVTQIKVLEAAAATAKSEAIAAAAADATQKANAAKQAAIDAAALDAQSKAETAEANAIQAAALDAQTKATNAATAAESAAKQHADLVAGNAETAAIEAAALDAQQKAAAAEQAAKEAAALDAQSKMETAEANAAIEAARVAAEKAAAAQAAAEQTAANALAPVASNASSAKGKIDAVTDANGKVVAGQVAGTLATTNIPALDASKVTTGTLPTAVKVGDGSLNSGISPAKLTGTGTIPETKVPALTEAKIPVLTEAKIPVLTTAKIPTLPQDKIQDLPAKIIEFNGTSSRVEGWTKTGTTFIDGGYLYTDSVKAQAIDVNDFWADTANIGAIKAGHVDTPSLEAQIFRSGAVPQNALAVGVDNLLPNPTFEFPDVRANYPMSSPFEYNTAAQTHLIGSVAALLRTEAAGAYNAVAIGPAIDTKPGEKFYMKWTGVRYNANTAATFNLQVKDADGNVVMYDLTAITMQPSATNSAFITYEGVVTVPANGFSITPQLKHRNNVAGSVGWWAWSDMELRRVMSSVNVNGEAVEVSPQGMKMWHSNGVRAMEVMADGIRQWNSSNEVLLDIGNGGTNTITGRIQTGSNGKPAAVMLATSDQGSRPGLFLTANGTVMGSDPGLYTDSDWMTLLRGKNAFGTGAPLITLGFELNGGMRPYVQIPSALNIPLSGDTNYNKPVMMNALGSLGVLDGAPDFYWSGDKYFATTSSGFAGIRGKDGGANEYSIALRNDHDNGIIGIRNGASGDSHMFSNCTYGKVTGASANVVLTSAGYFQRYSSSIKYKVALEKEADDIIDRLDGVDLWSWFDKGQAERLAAYHDAVLKGEPLVDKDGTPLDWGVPDTGLKRLIGLTAEQLHEQGLHEFVAYNDEGEPEGVQYDKLGVLWIAYKRRMDRETRELREQNERQQKQLDDQAAQIAALQAAVEELMKGARS